MTDEQSKEAKASDAPKKRWWTSLFSRRSKDTAGSRNIGEDQWTWLGDDSTAIAPNRKQPSRTLKIAGVVACSLVIAAVIAFAATSTGNDGDAQVNALPSPSRATVAIPTPDATRSPIATPGPTAEPTPQPTATMPPVTEAPTPKLPFELAVWDAGAAEWQTGDLAFRGSGSTNGDAVPFVLRIDNLATGQVYSVNIRYDCGAGGTAGFAFLTDYNRNLSGEPALAAGGPGSAVPDAAVPVLDDPSITTDDEQGERRIRVWGATFDQSPSAPVPATVCEGYKLVGTRLLARSKTVHLMWAGQVLTPNPSSPFGMEITIDGLPGTARLAAVPAQ